MRQAVRSWLWITVTVFVLYVGLSMAFFNDASYRILGMPPMLFWFTLIPLAAPLLLGWLYVQDQKTNPQWDEEGFK